MTIRAKTVLATIILLVLIGIGGLAVWMMSHKPPAPIPAPEESVTVLPDPGALIQVSMTSTVGILLDEIPSAERDALVRSLLAKPLAYWKDLATRQVRFTTLRRNYGASYGKKPLPLPPEEVWNVEVTGQPKRQTVENHDVVTIPYRFDSTLLTDTASPSSSEEALGNIGGIWEDSLVLPLDPQFVFQRTGFACMNESESPPNSIDAEEADFYYDQKCHVEDKLSNIGCHQTLMPTQSCVDAVATHIGSAKPVMRFERLPWDATVADKVRVGTVTNPDGPDLMPIQKRFQEHRFTYRYIPETSCTLIEKCVGGPGWRQLLMFPTGDVNVGAKPLNIGRVDYFHNQDGSLLADHGVYEYSACHQHYHFSHYGSFSLGDQSDGLNRKQAFCLQPTSRPWNNELSPLNHPYSNCIDQGVAVGWLDEYQMGLECQWLDVTDVTKNKDSRLAFTSNPDAMMCEGVLKFDAAGKQLFEKTSFKTSDGKPVDRPQCDLYQNWNANNTVSYDVHIPDAGEGYITEPCGSGEFGPLRNCGLRQQRDLFHCEPGTPVTMTCDAKANAPAQVIRFCEASHALGTGIPCTYSDALANQIIPYGGSVTFHCPAARDEKVETGGSFAAFTGALFPEKGTVPIHCALTTSTQP
jgi:hypothetical protein